jgi:hypothetical protein
MLSSRDTSAWGCCKLSCCYMPSTLSYYWRDADANKQIILLDPTLHKWSASEQRLALRAPANHAQAWSSGRMQRWVWRWRLSLAPWPKTAAPMSSGELLRLSSADLSTIFSTKCAT